MWVGFRQSVIILHDSLVGTSTSFTSLLYLFVYSWQESSRHLTFHIIMEGGRVDPDLIYFVLDIYTNQMYTLYKCCFFSCYAVALKFQKATANSIHKIFQMQQQNTATKLKKKKHQKPGIMSRKQPETRCNPAENISARLANCLPANAEESIQICNLLEKSLIPGIASCKICGHEGEMQKTSNSRVLPISNSCLV